MCSEMLKSIAAVAIQGSIKDPDLYFIRTLCSQKSYHATQSKERVIIILFLIHGAIL